MSDDEDVQLAAAKQWTRWEMATSKLFPDVTNIDKADDAKYAHSISLRHTHTEEQHRFMSRLSRLAVRAPG